MDQTTMSGHTEGSEDEFTNEWSERVFSEVVEINNYPSLEKGEAQTYVAMENLKPNTLERFKTLLPERIQIFCTSI